MASALMRRSALTALLAAVATIASPLATSAFAATPLGAPTGVAPSGTDKETRPTVTFTYAAPLDESQSTISVIDTSQNNASVPCAVSFSTDAKTINCAVQQDLVDKHNYTASASVVNGTDPTDKHTGSSADSTSWTTDIPSEFKQNPANGSINASVPSISVAFDEPISTIGGDPNTSKITVDIVNSAGHHVQTSGHTSGTDQPPVPPNSSVPVAGTATWTSDVGGLAPGTYTASFRVFATNNPALMPAPAVANDWGTAVVTFTVDTSLPADAPHDVQGPTTSGGAPQITQANVKAVPFHGFAPVGSSVAVAIYDENFDSQDFPCCDTEGTGPNDSLGTAVTPNCPDDQSETSLNFVKLCPFTVLVDASNSPDTGTLEQPTAGAPYPESLQWYAYTFTSAGQKPTHACPDTSSSDCPVADATITKDTTGPSKPSGGDARWNEASNSVAVENATDPDTDGTFDHYVIQVVDPEGNIVSQTPTNKTTPGLAMNATDVPVNSLLDGPLTVNIYGSDQWGNLSAADPAQLSAPTSPTDNPTLTKEALQTAPTVDTTNDTVTSAGTTYHFTCASSSNSCIALTPTTRLNTPTSVTVYFNEPIKLSQSNTAGTTNRTIKSEICLDDSTGAGSCLNHGTGTTTLTPDSRGLIWTAPAGYSLPSDNYSVSAFAISKYNCPDETNSNSANYPGCDTTPQAFQDPVDDSAFILDEQPPTVTFTTVPSLIDATNINAVTIGGKSDGDTTNVTLTVKSSGGGAARVISVNTTPTSDGSGTIDWSTTQDLSGLPDGTLTLTATGVDGAGNRTSAANAATTSTTMHARPDAPQNLSTAAGNGTIVLVWGAPSYTGGANVPLTGYTLSLTDTSTPGSGPMTFAIDPSATTYTVNNLANGHTYSVALSAGNSIGNGAAATTTATPKGNTQVGFTPPHVITAGHAFTLKGKLTYAGVGLGGEPITITSVYYNGKHGPTYHATTDQFGNWTAGSTKPTKNITYIASFPGNTSYNASSTAHRVLVRVAIAITRVTSRSSSHFSSVTLLGKVGPNMHGRTVYLYERIGRHNHLLGHVHLTSKSTFSFRHTFARGKHVVFAKFNSQNGNQGNTSRSVKFSRT